MEQYNNKIQIQRYHSPCGELLIGSFQGKLCLCDWTERKKRMLIDKRLQHALNAVYKEEPSDVTHEAIRQLNEYFEKKRRAFDIAILPIGTSFQKSVWCKLQEIPYGKTLSYGELAQKMNHPTAIRAVANANGANAVSIFIPCHRIIGSNHSLTGYAGGTEAKRFLLQLEQENDFFENP